MLRGLWEDVRDALRLLIKRPGFAAVSMLTLAVGVGANTAIFSLLHAVVLRDLPYRDTDRLALLWSLNERQNLPDGSSFLNFRDWKAQSRTFEDMAVYRRPGLTRVTITSGGAPEPERIELSLVGPDFFGVLATPPHLGRVLEPADLASGQRPIVISHDLWRRRFSSDPAVLGRPLHVDNQSGVIVGVMSPEFAFPTSEVEVWAPLSLFPGWERIQTDPRSRGADMFMVVGRLAPDATLASARAELDTIANRLRATYPDANAGRGVLIEPFTDHVLGPRTGRSLWLLLGAVGFVLLIACANVANLALARGAGRRGELSLRTALGASRARLVRQALAESVAIAACAAVVGVLFAWIAAAALRTWASASLPRVQDVRLDLPVLLFALAVSLACGVAAGLLPAWQLSAVNPADALRDDGSRAVGGRHGRRLRYGLVIAEIALAVILLSGAGLLGRSFVRLQTADRGFDSRHLLLLQIDLPRKYDGQAAKAEYFREAFARIRALPGVTAAGAISDLFIERQPDLRIAVEGQPGPAPGTPVPPLIRDRVIPGYFEALGTPLLDGRMLRDSDLLADIDVASPEAVVINEAMARQFWPNQPVVGKRFKVGQNPRDKDPWMTVVGVVADMKRRNLDEPAVPSIFWSGFGSQMDVVVRTAGHPALMRDAVRSALQSVDPTTPPFGVIMVEQRLNETVGIRTLQTLLLGALAAAALVLAVIGVYGIVHRSVQARTQEIGVRMALGASGASVLRLVLANALGLAAAGLALGLFGTFALSRTLASFLYETSPVDPVVYAAVAVLLVLVTTAACLIPARRAARVDPLVALRTQ